jgi:hypothetical protein
MEKGRLANLTRIAKRGYHRESGALTLGHENFLPFVYIVCRKTPWQKFGTAGSQIKNQPLRYMNQIAS